MVVPLETRDSCFGGGKIDNNVTLLGCVDNEKKLLRHRVKPSPPPLLQTSF